MLAFAGNVASICTDGLGKQVCGGVPPRDRLLGSNAHVFRQGRLMKVLRNPLRFSSVVLAFAALGCSGNDARKCAVSTQENGDVRVSCPGSRTIVIPAGADADGGGEECRTTQNAATGEYLLECQGTTVSLGRCGLGFAGSVFLGPDTHSAMESFPSVDRRMNSRNIASFLDNGCSRVLGTVVVTSARPQSTGRC